MDWAARLEPVAGPLLGAARRFLAEHPGAPSGVGPGGAGLATLADAIEDWADRDDAPAELDETFVEGAGAVLGLALLAHTGGRHVARGPTHRLRLGADGFFDPFDAIERALDADDARASLAADLRRAEAEAAGEAGVGRAMRLLRRLLAVARPDLSITERFGPAVWLDGGIELDLAPILRATEGEPDGAAERAVDKLVSMLPGGPGARAMDWEEVAPRLLPRLVAPGFAARLGAEGRGALAARARLGGALEVTLVLRYEDRSRYVRDDELDAWGQPFEAALARAVVGLAARSERARFARVDTTSGPLVVARTGDGLDGARLLLPTLHEVLSAELGPTVWVGAPHRDALWACADEPGLRESLGLRVREDARRAPHAVTERLFRLDAAGLRA